MLSAFAVPGFAQSVPATTPAQTGAKLVAERDAAWLKAHPQSVSTMAHPAAKHVKQAKHVKRAKKSKPTKPKTI